MLTLQKLKEMKSNTIFAKGEIVDSPEGCNVANTKKIMPWVAVRGGIHDWYIAVQNPYSIGNEIWDWDKIKDWGDKIHDEENIKKLVLCNNESFEMYNH